MSYLRFVCLLASTLATAAVLMAVAQSPALQRGISVELAVTSNAAPMPDADSPDTWIVSIAADGSLYFGIDPVTRNGLLDAMIRAPRNREQKLYIKADDRVPYADVEYVLKAAHTAEFNTPVLLTSQPESAPQGTIVPPKGLEVSLDAPSSSEAGAVQVSISAQPSSTLQVNNRDVPKDALRSTLRLLLQNQAEKVVVVKSAGTVPFAQVAYVLDISRSIGARIVLATPTL